MYGQPACRAVPEALASQVGRRFTSPCVLRSIRDRGVSGRCLPRGARHVPPLVPVVGFERPSRKFRGLSSQPTKTDSRTLARESQGSPRPRTPSLWRLETLGEAPCSELCNRSSLSCASTLRLRRARSRHEVASAVMLLLSSRPVDLAVGRPVFSRRCSLASRGCGAPFGRTGKALRWWPARVRSVRSRLRRLPLRMRAHRPESPMSRGVALQR